MSDSAYLKVDRASEHVAQLNDLVRKSPPFAYMVETNVNTGERASFAKKNEPVIDAVALLCGDAIHNLRCALDHAYWEIASPFASTPRERRAVQFPFSETAARLDEAIKNRLADRVGGNFFIAMQKLAPHGEAGGNKLLYFIHEMDVLDKHKLLIPTADYTRVAATDLRQAIPGIPMNLVGFASFGQNRRDISWTDQSYIWSRQRRRAAEIAPDGKFEEEVNVPVGIAFPSVPAGNSRPMIPTLHQLVDMTKVAIDIMRKYA